MTNKQLQYQISVVDSYISNKLYQESVEYLKKTLILFPLSPVLNHRMGLSYYFLGEHENSKLYYNKSLEHDSFNHIVWDNLGITLKELGKLDEAIKCHKKALDLNHKWFIAHHNLADVLVLQQKIDEAEKEYNTAIMLNPSHRDSYYKLGFLFQKKQEYEKAIPYYKTSIGLDPDYYPNFVNLAFCYVELKNYLEATELLKKALQNNNLESEIKALLYYNIGTIEQKQRLIEASINSLKNAINLKKDFPLARWNISLSLLSYGRLKEAWAQYEFRFKSGEVVKRRFTKPYYTGEVLKDQKLLVWSEQGLGDTFQFGTCLVDLEKQSENIIVECDPRVVDLFQRRFPKMTVRAPSKLEDFDFQIGMGSLPKYFRPALESFPKKLNYITPKKELVRFWKKKLDSIEGRKIGFCWRSSYTNKERESFYSKIEDWKGILSIPNTKWIVLQYDDCDNEIEELKNFHNIEVIKLDVDLKNDLENGLALMANLDLVVSVSTTISEMSGSINVPTWRIDQERYWFNHGQKIKPWYPTSRIIDYKEHPIDALKIAEKDLKELVNGPNAVDIEPGTI